MEFVELNRRFQAWLWDEQGGPALRYSRRGLRVLLALAGDLHSGDLPMRARSLVFTTLLAMVPLMAVVFSVLKAFDVHHLVRPFLDDLLTPLGERGAELSSQVMVFIDNLNVGLLGGLGLLMLFYLTLDVIEKVEEAFNHVWQVSDTRPLLQRISNYLSTLVVGPVLIFAALGVMTSMTANVLVQKLLAMEPFGTLLYLGGLLLPYLFTVLAFLLAYILLPNTRVLWRHALLGALIAAIVWRLSGALFGVLVATSPRYDVLYSGFALAIVFMLWLYISWLIFLAGAQLVFYFQNPSFCRQRREVIQTSTPALRLGLFFYLSRLFVEGEAPPDSLVLQRHFQVPPKVLADSLTQLQNKQLITSLDGSIGWIPARDPGQISLGELLRAVAPAEMEPHLPGDLAPLVGRALRLAEASAGEELKLSVREWLISGDAGKGTA